MVPFTLGNLGQTVQECHGTAEGLEGDLSRESAVVIGAEVFTSIRLPSMRISASSIAAGRRT
jgi:hypothetical protein